MEKIFEKYLELLYGFFLYDLDVFSKWWLYLPLCIPAAFYFAFFLVKWIVLLMPVIIILNSITTIFRSIFSCNCKKKLKIKDTEERLLRD